MTQFCRSKWLVVAPALAVATGCGHKPVSVPVTAMDTRLEPQFVAKSEGPFASGKVPKDTLTGIVVDASTGIPIPRAQIIVLYQGSALTDSTGRFRVALPNQDVMIEIRHLAYIEARASALPRADSGQVAVFALHRYGYLCASALTGPVPLPGVTVVAHDVVTGEPPTGTVAVTVRDGEYRDSVSARAESRWSLVLNTAFNRQGRYDVTVRADGYRPWNGQGATRPANNCGPFTPALFHAWLIPE